MKQLDFNLIPIDIEKTKEKVEEELEKYRIFLLSQPIEEHPKVTQTFSLVTPSPNNQFHSSTEEIAIKRADYDKERKEHIKKMAMAVNRLARWERAIIIHRYMLLEDVYDYEVYNDLGMSESKYYRLKSRAFYNLAFALKIEVYKEGEAS